MSELTDLNRNVIFEHGFAIANGARAIIARNRTKLSDSQLDVFTDIERIDYANVEDVSTHILELATNGLLERAYASNGEPKILGDWDMSGIQADYEKICFLRTQAENTDSLKRISKTLRSSSFKTIDTIDPEEYATHRLHEYCRRIKESFAVVGHFVSDTTIGHEKQNALTALLLGLAVGFGKRIFVLQELPISKQMIDLGGVVHPYARLTDLEIALTARLSHWYTASTKEKTDQSKLRVAALTQKAALELGKAAAEYDDLLLRTYYETGSTKWATEARKFIIVGTKGSGKSAIYRVAENQAEIGKKVKRLFYEVTDIEVQRLFELAATYSDKIQPEFLFRSFWRFNLLLDIVDEAFPGDDPTLLYDDETASIVKWRTELGVPANEQFIERFLEFVKRNSSSGSIICNDDLLNARFTNFEPHLRSALDGYEIFLYADRLDEGWEADSEFSKSLVRTFVHECFLLKHAMPKTVKPVLFLRADIVNQLKEGLAEADKWDIGYLRWSKRQLKEMLGRRLLANSGDESEEADWTAILPTEIKAQDTLDYLIDRTYLRPRDAIQLLQIVIEQAESDSGLPANQDAVFRGLRIFSRERIINLSLELSASHPKLIFAINAILEKTGSHFDLNYEDLLKIVNSVGVKYNISWLSDQKALEALYNAGIVVFKDDDEAIMWYEDLPFDRAKSLTRLIKKVDFVARPLFLRWLGPKKIDSTEIRVSFHPTLHGLFDVLSFPVIYRGRAEMQPALDFGSSDRSFAELR